MADTNIKTNRRILRVLLTIQNRAIDLESQLRVDRKANEADQLGLGIDKLEFMIRVLRAKILDNWAAKVPDLRKKLTKMNDDVQDAIDDVEDDNETAKKVVSLIGRVDKVVGLLAPVIL